MPRISAILFFFFPVIVLASPPTIPVHMSIQYTTDGDVTFNIMNITFHTVQLEVTLLGCDYGFYDHYLIAPPKAAVQPPFDCVECVCEDFEFDRVEPFVVTGST